MLFDMDIGLDSELDIGLNNLKKKKQKEMIRNIAAPEIDKQYSQHKKELKSKENQLIEQIKSHSQSFCKDVKSSVKGDWIDSAISEVKKLEGDLEEVLE